MNQLFLQHPEWSTLKKILMFHGATAEQLTAYEASGNPVVFETNVSRPLQRLLLSLLPRQSGTGDPSPENIRPLIPWGEVGTWHGGKNLLPSINETQTINGITWTKNADGSVTLDGTATANSVYDFGRGILTLKAGTYTTKEQSSGNILLTVFHIVNGSANVLRSGGGAFTLTQDETIFLRYFVASGETVSKTIYPQIEVGSSATDYEPYTPVLAYPVNLQKNLVKTKDSSRESAGITYTVNDDGSVKAYGTTPENATSWFRAGTDYETQGTFLKKGTYRLTGGKTNDKLLYIVGKYVDGTTISNQTVTGGVYDRGEGLTFTLTDDAYITYQIQIRKGFSIDDTFYPMIRLANNGDDTFQPYLPPVYGGTLDVVSGVLTVEWKVETLDDSDAWTENDIFFSYSVHDISDRKTGESYGFYCTAFPAVQKSTGTAYIRWGGTTAYNLLIAKNGSSLTLAELKELSASGDLAICYELATPVLLATLTAQQVNALVGVNTVWSDADGIELTYLKKG